MELDPSAPMDPRLFTTDQLERTLRNLPTIHHQFAMEKELLVVLTDQLQKSDSTLAPAMRRNAQQDKPFTPCADGSKCSCPAGGKNCSFRYRVCGNGQACRKMCRMGQPHCPWFTKNRNKHDGIKTYNAGAMRPGNKGHNWGPDFVGNQ